MPTARQGGEARKSSTGAGENTEGAQCPPVGIRGAPGPFRWPLQAFTLCRGGGASQKPLQWAQGRGDALP